MQTLKEAKEYGKISFSNSKMPGSTFSFHTDVCFKKCSFCYARKIEKRYPSVLQHGINNYKGYLKADKMQWVDSMVYQLNHYNVKHHRWFAGGDLPKDQSFQCLIDIIEVCKQTPNTKHWLPTKDYKAIALLLKSNIDVPKNLVIRVSSPIVDGKPLAVSTKKDRVLSSTIFTVKLKENNELNFVNVRCNAELNKPKNCGDCRACWDEKINNVSYPLT